MGFAKRSGFAFVADQPADLGLAGGYGSSSTTIREVDHSQPVSHPTSVEALLAAPRGEKQQNLINKYFAVIAEIDSFLEATRTARLSTLSAQHDTAVEAARQAGAELGRAKEDEFEAYSRWEQLNQDVKNRGGELQAAQGQLENTNKALLKRSELKVIEAHIEKLRQALAKATATEGAAFTKYRALVMAREQAEQAHHAAVSNATSISSQIDRL